MVNSVDWGYFDKFQGILDKYMPSFGEGNNKASQVVTAVNKLIYKWYNDGDVFDNTYYLEGWLNNLSSYANWLANYYPNASKILHKIKNIYTNSEYEQLLKSLADEMLIESFLEEEEVKNKVGSIYNEKGEFCFLDELDEI